MRIDSSNEIAKPERTIKQENVMTSSGIKVIFILEKRAPITKPVEYIVETQNYDVAHEIARNQLILDGIDPTQYKRVLMADVCILKGR